MILCRNNGLFAAFTAAFLLFNGSVPGARADGGIVYSARYYYPPWVHATSHYHIYRIDPDGRHRVQLTFGRYDDSNPDWSPDGRWVAFTRKTDPKSSASVLIAMEQNGRSARVVAAISELNESWDWSPDSRELVASVCNCVKGSNEQHTSYTLSGRLIRVRSVPYSEDLASPDGSVRYVSLYPKDAGEFKDLKSGRIIAATAHDYTAFTWLGNTSLATMYKVDPNNLDRKLAGKYVFSYVSTTGNTIWSMGLTEPVSTKDYYDDEFRELQPYPERPGEFLAWQDWLMHGNEGVYYLIPAKGVFRFLGNCIRYGSSIHGHYICSTPYVGLTQYDEDRVVWTDPLQITDVDTGKTRKIVNGLVDVGMADWR